MELRTKRRLGPKGIQSELLRLHEGHLVTATIGKVLNALDAPKLSRVHQRPKLRSRRYQRAIRGERAQMDTMKTAPGLVHFPAVE